MLTRADIEKISSLSSSPPPAALAEDGFDNLPSHLPEQPGSPAFSTTSTADDDEGSSPILPPLPAPTFRGRTFERARTPSLESQTDSSYYYTASWGSPYQQAPASTRTRSHTHTNTLSSLGSEPDSPIRHLEFHTPFLRPAPTFGAPPTNPDFVSQDGLISAAVLANRARRPATGLTEDWIRQHTGGEAAERNHWLSDDPGESEHSSLSGSISGDSRDWLGPDPDPRTPTLKTFSEAARKRLRPRHRRIATTETLKQEDFLDSAIPTMALTDENGVPAMELELQTPVAERPPPPPPKEWQLEINPASHETTLPTSISPAPVAPRLKKKIPWKGKNILVLLPWDDERGRKGKAPAPMSEKDVMNMMKEWEQLGYDTSGFNLGPADPDSQEGGQCQSRSPWPLIRDMISERQQKSYRVSIPDRREWDDYVQELKEAKLRALGVSFGDDDPVPTISPAVSNMNSRRTSMQYPPLPFSPPIPTSSANSSHLTHIQNPFSPVLMSGAGLSTSQSSNPGSIASPVSMHAHMQGKYNPRQSVSFSGAEHPFGSPFQYPQQNSPTVWSPQQMLYQQGQLGHSRGGSPSISLQNLGALISPASPFSQDGYFPQNGDVLVQMQQRQQILQNQLALQQQLQLQGGARASPRLQEVREIPEEEGAAKSPSKTPEARQNKHNPSNSLQREIDEAEYHLEEQMQRELEHEDYSPHSDKEENHFAEKAAPGHLRNISSLQQGLGGLGTSRYADDSEDGPVLHHPQPHSRGHSLSQRPFHDSEESAPESKSGILGISDLAKPDLSDIETNPSNLGTPIQENGIPASGHGRSLSMASNPWADSDMNGTGDNSAHQRGHGPKPSMSKLNVAAKEFKFDPSTSFSKPSAFSFDGNNFQAPVNFAAFAPPVSATSSHFSRHSVSVSRSNINVAAPVFTPGRSEFNFSSSGPSFRPDAPTFTPLNTTFSDSIGSGSEGPKSSIFGNIDLHAISLVKPSKKSKAVPIVRPDSSHSRNVDDETMEGKDGRITQGEGRFKRVRGGKEDGDSVPLFAEPGMPLGETTREQSPPKEVLTVITAKADKENSAPLEGDDGELIPDLSDKAYPGDLTESSPENNKEFIPYEFNQQKHAEDFNAARPFTSRRYGSGLPAYGTFIPSASEDEFKDVGSEPQKVKGHKKSGSSLSATAKPFEFKPGAFSFTFGQPSDPTPALISPPSLPSASLPSAGLSASKYARSPSPPVDVTSPEIEMQPHESAQFQDSLPGPENPPSYSQDGDLEDREPTFEEIDAVMRQLNEAELESAPVDTPRWTQPSSPPRLIHMPDPDNSSPIRLQPQNLMRSDAPSPSPGRFQALPGHSNIFGRVQEDPFVAQNQPRFDSPVHRLNTADSLPPSEWDDVLSETEEAKLQHRAQFFDNHVNDLVGGILAERLDPLERTLETIQMSLDMMAARAPSSRRDRRSISGALSDADDEDDDHEIPRRSMSPRRDKKLDKIRAIVTEALATHQASRPQTATTVPELNALPESRNILNTLEEMKEQFGQSMRLDLRGEDLRNIVEEAVEKRLPATPKPVIDEAALVREAEYKAKIDELEERLLRADSDSTERLADLEDRLRRADTTAEEEIKTRRAAEDRLAEVQRLLRISSEEETRLRETVDERESKIREVTNEYDLKTRTTEEHHAKTTIRIALLEADQDNAQRVQSEHQNRIAIGENELRESRKEVQHWQMEAERALEAARRHSEDAEQANETNKDLRRTIESLRTQMEESIRVREGFRGKLMDLQEDMAAAAREITEENARRAKKEQELIARQEVLDARLQAEARTRERLETEIERLEAGEREGMRAVSDIKRMEVLLTELRLESHNAQKEAMRYQREFEEARESGLSEVQRTRHYMQAEIEAANNQVNVVREDLENQVLRLRAEIDHIKLDADTARAKSEMLLEEAETSKSSSLTDIKRIHADELEDIQTRHERQLNNALEDAQRGEQHLLERLSLSSAKTEHLQDRVSHLEEKLAIANEAANAAALAAKSARSASASSPTVVKHLGRSVELPEKVSPQALRESIMALQDQLQNRESTIEELESALSNVDLEAPTKISKRDDEIMWLRELLSVRKSDLQDIVTALEGGEYDAERVRDAAIRLRANLQMEEQERERAMNGGSAINLPNIAASLRDVAASPRVAQAVGPLAAAWGNWRKGRADSAVGQPLRPSSSSSTPNRNHSPSSQSFLSGLLTPPASNPNLRSNTPITSSLARSSEPQPTAFGSTGQRLTAGQLANRPRGMSKQSQLSLRGSPAKSVVPSTPPMMRKSSYDADARAEDFSDAGFYDDDESTVEDAPAAVMYSGKQVESW